MQSFEYIESGVLFNLTDPMNFKNFRYTGKDFAKHGEVLSFIIDYVDQYKETPSTATLSENYPTLDDSAQMLNFDYAVDQFKDQVVYRKIVGSIQSQKELLKENPTKALASIMTNLSDVEVETEHGCIGRLERSYSSDPQVVRKYAELMLKKHAQQRIATCLKHWPGLGADSGDTHQGMTNLTKVWKSERDEAPFHVLIESLKKTQPYQKVAVMTSHTVHTQLDPKVPSLTFSKKIIADQREKWGINNLFISDDLDMGALDDFLVGDKVVRALLAGNDIVILSQYRNYDETKVQKIHAYVRNILEKNDDQAIDLKKQIEESYGRVRDFKRSWFEEAVDTLV